MVQQVISIKDIELGAAWRKKSTEVYKKKNPYEEDTANAIFLCIVLNLSLTFLKLLMGLIYLDECTVNPRIPFYLVVEATSELLFFLTMIGRRFKTARVCRFPIGIFFLITFLATSMMIFAEWQPDYFEDAWRYCHRGFYMFALITSMGEYVILVIVVFLACIEFSFYDSRKYTIKR